MKIELKKSLRVYKKDVKLLCTSYFVLQRKNKKKSLSTRVIFITDGKRVSRLGSTDHIKIIATFMCRLLKYGQFAICDNFYL